MSVAYSGLKLTFVKFITCKSYTNVSGANFVDIVDFLDLQLSVFYV